MKVSVIIPGYRTDFIQETLQSVYNQTVPAHEILYIQDLGIMSDKINRMARIATGDAIIALSDDDMLDPTYIEKTSALMDQGYDVVYTDVQKFGLDSRIDRAADYSEEEFKKNNLYRGFC